jgi:thiol-disulfide isomerase/thioredoxin
LATLAQAPALEHLMIGSPAITDAAVERVRAGSPRLLTLQREAFQLEGTPVSRSRSPADPFWRNQAEEERQELNALEGQPSPPLAVTAWLNAAENSSLEDFRGKVVLVEFWGTWCGPCLAQMPEMRRLHDAYADQGLVVVGLHSTRDAEQAADYVKSNRIPWPVALDAADQSETAYCVRRWPTCFLIDRRGVLRMADIFKGDREAAIQMLLAEGE